MKNKTILDSAMKTRIRLRAISECISRGYHINQNIKFKPFVYIDDLVDISKLCSLILSHEFDKAKKYGKKLDTHVLKVLPRSLFNFITKP